MKLPEGKIFKALDKEFIQKLFERKKRLFFPLTKTKISDIKIERISPVWAKESCLVRYEISFNDNSKKIVRGSTKTNKLKKSNWEIMKYLYAHGFAGGNLRIRKPFAYIKNINLLLYEEVPGLTLTEIINKENKTIIVRTLKNIAKWLTKLHSLNLGHEKFPLAVFIKLNGYKKIFQKIRKYIPELKDDLIPIDNLSFINRLWYDKKSLIHNDFYPGNSIVNKNTIYGIDFDLAGFGPFLIDIATLYGALEFPKKIWKLKISKKQIHDFQEVFLKEYCRLRELDYIKTKKDLRKFLIKILLDQIHYYATFTIKGWKFMDKNTKSNFILKIKPLLLKTKQYLKNI